MNEVNTEAAINALTTALVQLTYAVRKIDKSLAGASYQLVARGELEEAEQQLAHVKDLLAAKPPPSSS